jgi:outer membrane lipoprotein-sorting protein
MVSLGAALALVSACTPVRAEQPVQAEADRVAPDERAVVEQQIFAKLVDHNQVRNEALLGYTATRTYRVSQPNGKVHAEIEGRMEFQAPDMKQFVVSSEQGSGLVRRLALHPLITSEVKAAAGKDRHDSAITPANYTLELIGEASVGPYRCYVLRALPKRVDKYLFQGKVWVDEQDFAVVRIEGQPAAKLSFWIKRAEFVRQYQKVDGFWLPQRDETVVDIRIYGQKLLTIDHGDYIVKGAPGAAAQLR